MSDYYYSSDGDEAPATYETGTDWAPLVTSLTELAQDYPPYIAGTLTLPDSAFDLYYKDCNGDSHSINFVSASKEQLDALMQACQPASFGYDGKDVIDEAYRKAGKMDTSAFSTPLVPERTELAKIVHDFLFEGEDHKLSVVMELYKLNIYGKDSFFKEHVDTPRGRNMKGSLVIILPTHHHGGELVIHPEEEDPYTFDSGSLLASGDARIGYTAFYSDVSHEVLPVTEGHRVTLTFNLYAGELKRKISTPTTVSVRMAQFKDHLDRLLRDDSLLPDGGLLVFGLHHAYPVTGNDNVSRAYAMLKGVDRVLWSMLDDMGLDPDMHLLYDVQVGDYYGQPDPKTLVSWAINFRDEESVERRIRSESTLREEKIDRKNVVWVTPVNQLTRIEQAHVYYGNEASLEWVYADLCLIARVQSYTARNEISTVESVQGNDQEDAES